MKVSDLPFNRYLGIEPAQDAAEAGVALHVESHHLNHIETIHATVLFGIAEAASGHCLLQRFPGLLTSHVAVLRTSSVKYRRPGMPHDRIQAAGKIDTEAEARFSEELSDRGRATIDVTVAVSQNNTELLTGTFGWFVSAQ